MINFEYTSVEYKVNSLGYRSPEFNTINWTECYIIQGCSAVFGTGTKEDDQITSHYLSEMIGAPVINLGVPGSGMGVQYVNALEMLENNIKPKGVFIIYPSMDRYSLYTNGKLENIGPWSNDKQLEWMLNNNSREHNLNLMRGYRLLWKLADVPLYEWSHHVTNRSFCNEVISWDDYLDYGFDNEHWGSKTSKAIAEILFDQFKKRNTETIK